MDVRELKPQEIRSLIDQLFRPEGWKDEGIFESLCVYFSDDDIACVYELFTKRGDTQSYYWLVKYLVQIERPFGFEKLFSLFLQDNEAVRRIARQGIVKIAPDERYGLLLRMLDLKQEREVCFAAEELGVVGKIQAIPELLNLLEQSDNEKIQVSVLRALGRLQDPRSLRALEKSVKNGSPRIQEEAIVSLYKFTSIPNHRFLKKCFESDSSRVLEVSYFTAARSRDRRIEPYLAQGLAKQSNTTLQFNILSSLRRIQTRPLYEMVCWLALDGVSSEVRMIAQSALRRSRSKRMLSWLLKDEKKMAGRQKVLILKLMADYTDEKKIFNIISKNAMTGREGQSRLLAIEILGTIAARESRNVLAKIITTGDEFSYAATIAYLNHVQPEDWPFINQILLKREKKYELIQQLILNFFIKLPKKSKLSPVAEQQIQTFITSSNIFLKSLAVRVAFRLQTAASFKQLQTLVVHDAEKKVRYAALQSLVSAIEINELLFLELLVNSQRDYRLISVANDVAKQINLGNVQYETLLVQTINTIAEQQKYSEKQLGFNRKQYVVILRSFVVQRLDQLLAVLKRIPWSGAQALVVMSLLNSLKIEALEDGDMQFLIEQFHRSTSDDAKKEFLRFFQTLKVRTPELERVVFETLSQATSEVLRHQVQQVVASWVVLSERGGRT